MVDGRFFWFLWPRSPRILVFFLFFYWFLHVHVHVFCIGFLVVLGLIGLPFNYRSGLEMD